MNLREVSLQPIARIDEKRFQALMQAHHYLGALPKIGHTLWYVATWRGEWLSLLSFSAAAWKCAARDHWIGWNFRYQYDRLHLIANNSRLLILPQHHYPNLASRVLSLCEQRLKQDWRERFGYPLLLLETFVDPRYFQEKHGTDHGFPDVGRMSVSEIRQRFPALSTVSMDKGFHTPANQIALKERLDLVILPKKGRLSKADKVREYDRDFIELRHQHSAVESAINALESHGLDKCPDHGIEGFKRYVSMAIVARNVHRLGAVLR